MGFSLFPKTYKFYEMFELQHQKIKQALQILKSIFNDPTDMNRKCKEITLIEDEGNRISSDITRLLSSTFITPIDREDIHEINVAQEALLNSIKSLANRVNMYNIDKATKASIELVENLDMILNEHEQILKAMTHKKDAIENIRKIKKLKEDSDTVLMHGIHNIYSLNPKDDNIVLEVIKWTQIYDRLEKTIIRADNLANIMEGICVKYA